MSKDKAGAAHFKRIRKELAEMLGCNGDPDALPVDQAMRLDVVFGLKLSLDEMRGRIYRGEPVDTDEMRKIADTLEKYLPPRPEPKATNDDGSDPRENLLRIVENFIEADKTARAEREAERVAAGLPPLPADLESAQREIEHLREENNALRFWAEPDGKALPARDAKVITPRDSDIMEPFRDATGPQQRAPDDPPKRSTAVIDAKANPPAPQSGLRPVPGLGPNQARSGHETKAAMARLSADKSIDFRVMTESGPRFEPQPSLGSEPWRFRRSGF